MKKILVATDFSPHAERALEAALEMARAFDGTITLFHAWQPPVPAYTDGVALVASPELEREIIDKVERDLAHWRERVAQRGIGVDSRYEPGTPADAIVRFAQAHGIELIVLGTHGRRGLRRLVLGSVAESVVRLADVPVLTVRSPAEAK
jgi:nucleotide-binding universal stress UspA family protein